MFGAAVAYDAEPRMLLWDDDALSYDAVSKIPHIGVQSTMMKPNMLEELISPCSLRIDPERNPKLSIHQACHDRTVTDTTAAYARIFRYEFQVWTRHLMTP